MNRTMVVLKIPCHYCMRIFDSFGDLEQHIFDEVAKKGTLTAKSHWHSYAWALKYSQRRLLRAKVELKRVPRDPDAVETEYGKENKAKAKLALSGEARYATCVCPQCYNPHRPLLPVEFLGLGHLWRIRDKPAVLCDSCRKA